MTWKLFIDDERYPCDVSSHIARSSQDAIWIVEHRGMPIHIDFDHDLSGDDKAIYFVNWLGKQLMDGKLSFPEGFTYAVHSQNPIGQANIKGKMDAYLKHFS